MAVNPTTVPGASLALQITFRLYQSGPPVDDDRYAAEGTLPRFRPISPNGDYYGDSAAIGTNIVVTRQAQGVYSVIWPVPQEAPEGQWTAEWSLQLSGAERGFAQPFYLEAAGSADLGPDPDSEEFRVGFAFRNPNLTSDYFNKNFQGIDQARPWGHLVTPDELRYIVAFGNRLTSPDASQAFDDKMLQYYIDVSLAMIERDLNIDLLPRIVRHQDPIINPYQISLAGNPTIGPIRTTDERTPRTDIPPNEVNIREPGYPYRWIHAQNYMFVRLRRRPVRGLLKAVMADPVRGTVIDLYCWRHVKDGFEGTVQFFPNAPFASFLNFPSQVGYIQYPFEGFPDALLIDYQTGYSRADEVPIEFRSVLLWTAGIMLLEDYGDGKSPGLASASASLNSVSESYTTTQSATNALFGARIVYYKEHLKNWLKKNEQKYSQTLLGVL